MMCRLQDTMTVTDFALRRCLGLVRQNREEMKHMISSASGGFNILKTCVRSFHALEI